MALNLTLTVVSAFIILIVNTMLKLILKYFGKFERFSLIINLFNVLQNIFLFNRYKTITVETTETVGRIFISMFFNTAIITLIMNANIYGFIPTVAISKALP
jgi:hypothetical protein